MANDGPLTSREALLFEELAGVTVLGALQQLREGTLSASACVAAVLVYGRRNAADVAVEDVLDTYPEFAPLAEAGEEVLRRMLLTDPEPAEPAEGDQ